MSAQLSWAQHDWQTTFCSYDFQQTLSTGNTGQIRAIQEEKDRQRTTECACVYKDENHLTKQ